MDTPITRRDTEFRKMQPVRLAFPVTSMNVTNPPIGSAIKGSTVIPKIGLSASNMITAKGPSIAVKKFGRSLDTAESSCNAPQTPQFPF